MPPEPISLPQARRIALAAQGFAAPRPASAPNQGHLRRVIDRLSLLQIDSVNVLSRAHYLPLFSRLGAYDRTLLDKAAWTRPRRLFEYWAHEASLLPLPMHPLLRWRMQSAERGDSGWGSLRLFATEKRAAAQAILARITAEGPLTAGDFEDGKSTSGWWGWSEPKRALEYLFWSGQLTVATRRAGFTRVYDLPARVLPEAILALPTPTEADAHRALLSISARALGIATAADLRDYFRLSPAATPRLAELVEQGTLIPVKIPNWPAAYLHCDAARPRRIKAQALLAPFDPMIFDRARTQRLFGTRYRIEIYTPAAKRVHGYYVLPFLLGDRIVARVDLKADRQNACLLVQSAHAEPAAPADTAAALATELRAMAAWLGLDTVTIVGPGDLASLLSPRINH